MTYVSNTIGVPTHGVNLWHHELRIGEERKRGERKRGRKREREADAVFCIEVVLGRLA
jgi:hypothetical protein